MAHMIPPQWSDTRPDREAEHLVYQKLKTLPDEWTIFHDMEWNAYPATRRTSHIQADFLVCHPEWGVLVIEVKGGQHIWCQDNQWFVERRNGQIIPYKQTPKEQAKNAGFKLYELMKSTTGEFPSKSIMYAVCFPEIDVPEASLDRSLEREIVLDREELENIEESLIKISRYWEQRQELWRRNDVILEQRWIDKIKDILARDKDLRQWLNKTITFHRRRIQELSEEQAAIYDALCDNEPRLAIPGCAGSGKTMLACLLARKLATDRGLRVLLCCYNRPLRDELQTLLADESGITVSTYYQVVNRQRQQPYDAIIVDEGQDMDDQWWPNLQSLLRNKKNGIFYVFYDDNQILYRRAINLPPRMRTRSLSENFRTTKPIHDQVQYFYRGSSTLKVVCQDGDEPYFRPYNDTAELFFHLREFLSRLRDDGVNPDDVIILTPHAADKSLLPEYDPQLEIATIDNLTAPPDSIRWTTIHRFKGLERPVVIVVEIDQDVLNQGIYRVLLYVAYSRPTTFLAALYHKDIREDDIRAGLGRVRHGRPATTDALDNDQQKVVKAPFEVQLVWAGAGSGKTRVLIHRIAFLLESYDVRPENVVAVTFTKKAANELGQRLETLLTPTISSRVIAANFHRLAYAILQRDIAEADKSGAFLGRNAALNVISARDRERILKRIVETSDNMGVSPEGLGIFIEKHKRDNQLPEDLIGANTTYDTPRDQKLLEFYRAYQQTLMTNNYADFDDLLVLAVRLLEEVPTVLQRWQRRASHLLVDEFQDTNHIQFNLVRLLQPPDHPDLGRTRSLMVVGDAQQAIYSWRGADYHIFLGVSKMYQQTKKYELRRNYRSTEPIVDAALEIADPRFTGVPRLPMEAVNKTQAPDITVLTHKDIKSEAKTVVEWIERHLTEGINERDIVLLVRARDAQTIQELTTAFRQRSISYHVQGVQDFYNNSYVRLMTAFLRSAINPEHDASLEYLFESNLTPHVGPKLVASLKEKAREYGCSLWQMWRQDTQGTQPIEARVDGLGPSRNEACRHTVEMVQTARDILNRQSDVEIWDQLTQIRINTGFERQILPTGRDLADPDNPRNQAMAVLNEYTRLIVERINAGETLEEALNSLHIYQEAPDVSGSSGSGSVIVQTIHSAKGLEFPIVFVLGLEEGSLPSHQSIDNHTEHEEGRVCYVAVTRAQKQLYLTCAENRGNGEPSRFLRAIQTMLARGVEHHLWEELDLLNSYIYPISISQEEDHILFLSNPVQLVLDARETLLADPDFDHIQAVIRSIPGVFPAKLRYSDDEEIVDHDLGTVCGHPDAIDILARETRLPVLREPIS